MRISDWSSDVCSSDLKVQEYISSLNWGYRTDLRDKKVEYLNAYGVFVDPHTVEPTNRAGKKTTITARRFIVATGGRPRSDERRVVKECVRTCRLRWAP